MKAYSMTAEQRIIIALSKPDCKDFLHSQLPTLRDNILECEKRISKTFIIILSLIGISMLIELKIIQKIAFFSAEINNLGLVLLVMPCIISFYTYSLFNQIILRRTLGTAYSQIIESKYPNLVGLDIDDFLLTHLGSSVETILTRGKQSWYKRVVDILSAPFFLVFQYLPVWYCYYLIHHLFQNQFYTKTALWSCLIITTLFFARGVILIVAKMKDEGGLWCQAKRLMGIENTK